LSAELSRRALLAGAALLLATTRAAARGRTTVGGRVSLRIPWAVSAIDPHRLDDPMAALFGEALFDTLYARDDAGALVAGLAESEPEPEGASLRVKLRGGIRTGKGKTFDAKDALFALGRARGAGARAWLADIPTPRADARSLLFPTRDAARLVRALASPLVAMVPTGFAPDAPDGTGPFKLTARGDAMVLTRNALSARGPSFLDEVVLRAAGSRAASLRSFEGGADDIGWHGLGMHDPRANAKPFDLGAVGWAVLSTGREANDWDAPGVAQRVCDEITPSRLKEFNLGPAWSPDTQQGWNGPPGAIFVRDDAPWLVDLAGAIAATISRPSHEVGVKAVSVAELAQRRSARSHVLALDLVRPIAPGALGAMIALATADNAGRASELVQKPPRLGEASARTLTRTLRCGVVGEVRVQGGRVPELTLASSSAAFGWDLGASSMRARR
jgi:peptide/nickel transport system substrate-binding protein